MSNNQESFQKRSKEFSNPKLSFEGKRNFSLGFKKPWEERFFLLSLCLPLTLQVFFHPGTTAEYRIVVISLQLITIITGIICLSPLSLEIPKKIQIVILLWLVWGWICAINSPYPVLSCMRQIEWTILVLFTGLLTAIFRKNPLLVYWTYGMILVGFLLVVMGIVVYWNFIPYPEHYDWVTMMPHFTNIRNFGHYAAAGTILSSIGSVWMTHEWQKSRRKLIQLTLFSTQTIAFCFLFWSGGRGSVIAVGLGILWFLFWGVARNKRWIFALMTTLSGCAGFILASFFTVQNLSLGLLNMFGRTIGASSLDRLLSGRVVLWKTAIKIILPPEQHLLFGYGPDSFRMHPDIEILPWIIQPHNVFIQTLLEWGIPGALLFCLFLLFIYTSCWKQACNIKVNGFDLKHLPILGSQALWISFFFLGLIDGVFYHALPLTILGACAAISFSSNHLSKDNI